MDNQNQQRRQLLQALAVLCELLGMVLSEPAARTLVDDLGAYEHAAVMAALGRCRREVKGRLTLAAIVERIDDDRPGPNEAWAMIPHTEDESCVWTTEMQVAYGIAAPLLRAGQPIPARMAFIEAYERLVARARAERRPPLWQPSLGCNKSTHAAMLEEAVRRGRMTPAHACLLRPVRVEPSNISPLPALSTTRGLTPASVRRLLTHLTSAK